MRGAGVTVLSQGMGLALQVVATVILARLLTPADFGVVAMVTAFSLLLTNFGLNGFTEAVVQWERLDQGLASNLFWINITVGFTLTVLFAAGASILAWFYREPTVVAVASGVSLSIFLTSISVLHLALLRRAMLYDAVAINDIISRVVSVGVSIALAWKGWGYWALVVALIAQPLSNSIGALAICSWMPSLPRRVNGTGSILRFAMNVYARFTVRYFSRNLDNILVGWRFNAIALGFYKKAYDLFALPAGQLVSPLTVVAISALSRLRGDPDRFKRYLLSSVAVVALLAMAIGADLTLTGKDVIRVVLGPRWEESGRIFVFFGPGIGFMLLHGVHGWIHLSLGRADRWLRWTILEFVCMALLLVLALPWGPVGVAFAWTAFFLIFTLPALWYAGQPIQLGAWPLLAAIWKSVVAALFAYLASAAILYRFPTLARTTTVGYALMGAGGVSALFLALYVGAVVVFNGSCAPLSQLVRLTREMVPRKAVDQAVDSTPTVMRA